MNLVRRWSTTATCLRLRFSADTARSPAQGVRDRWADYREDLDAFLGMSRSSARSAVVLYGHSMARWSCSTNCCKHPKGSPVRSDQRSAARGVGKALSMVMPVLSRVSPRSRWPGDRWRLSTRDLRH